MRCMPNPSPSLRSLLADQLARANSSPPAQASPLEPWPPPVPPLHHPRRKALNVKLQQLGFELPQEQLNELFKRFKTLVDKKKVGGWVGVLFSSWGPWGANKAAQRPVQAVLEGLVDKNKVRCIAPPCTSCTAPAHLCPLSTPFAFQLCGPCTFFWLPGHPHPHPTTLIITTKRKMAMSLVGETTRPNPPFPTLLRCAMLCCRTSATRTCWHW